MESLQLAVVQNPATQEALQKTYSSIEVQELAWRRISQCVISFCVIVFASFWFFTASLKQAIGASVLTILLQIFHGHPRYNQKFQAYLNQGAMRWVRAFQALGIKKASALQVVAKLGQSLRAFFYNLLTSSLFMFIANPTLFETAPTTFISLAAAGALTGVYAESLWQMTLLRWKNTPDPEIDRITEMTNYLLRIFGACVGPLMFFEETRATGQILLFGSGTLAIVAALLAGPFIKMGRINKRYVESTLVFQIFGRSRSC